MEVLSEIRDKLDINNKEFDELEKELEKIETLLSKEGIIFEKQLKIGFCSHISSLIKRLKNKEQVMKIDNEITHQLSDYSLDIGRQIVSPLFNKYKMEVDNSEVILVAIYIQTAIANKKGGETNGRR